MNRIMCCRWCGIVMTYEETEAAAETGLRECEQCQLEADQEEMRTGFRGVAFCPDEDWHDVYGQAEMN